MRRARSPAKRGAAAAAAAAEAQAGALARYVDLVVAQLPPGLVGPDRESHIRGAVRNVPAELAASFGFECRIDLESPAADLVISADAETGGLQMLAGRHPLVALPRTLSQSAAWAPVIGFCARRQPGHELHRATADVWAEFALQPGCEPTPNFSFGMRLAGLPEATRRPLEVLIRALELGFEALAGDAWTEPTANAAALRSLLRRLPETARVVRAGRVEGDDAARLWLSRMTREQIVDLVEFAREHREARATARVLEDVIASNVSVQPRFDVGTGVGPLTRLSCTVDSKGSPTTVSARWGPLLDRLVEYELCTIDKRDALLHAFGLLRENRSDHWPEHLSRLSELFGDGAESIVSWRLANVDVHCDRGEPVAATATILATHGWSRR